MISWRRPTTPPVSNPAGVKPRTVRGEIWFADLDPTHGHEQAGRRPVLIISDDAYNRSRVAMVVALPLTKTLRG